MTQLTIPDLAGKAVLVTGASTGIGAALAKALGAQGAMVGVHYNSSKDAAEAVAKAVKDAGGQAFLVRADASRSGEIARAVEDTAAAFGRLDGLVNNAGGMVGRMAYADMDDAYYDKVMDLNGRSVIAASRAAIPHLKRQGGFIINTSSIAARNGASNGAGLYGSSKALVSNITRGMAKELVGFGIRVNAVAPGRVATPMAKLSSAERNQAALGRIPLGRFAEPDEIADSVVYLLSEQASYITGITLNVSGGYVVS